MESASPTVGLLIDGTVIERPGFPIFDPASAAVCGFAAQATKDDVSNAVGAAARAFQSWRQTDLDYRVEAIAKMKEALIPELETLAAMTTMENGKPLFLARAEMQGMIKSSFDGLSSIAPRALAAETLEGQPGTKVEQRHVPVGVVAAIIPWNFPVHTTFQKVVPALLAGNTVVVKPSPFAPLAILKAIQIAAAVLPAGVVNVVCGEDGPSETVAHWLTAAPAVRIISFTGSTATGKKVMVAAAADLKRVLLELGGNDAAIVLPSFPEGQDGLDLAKSIVWGAMWNSGQVCHGLKRLYVHEAVHDRVVSSLKDEVEQLKLGAGTEEGTKLGPLTTEQQLQHVSKLVDAAKASGATVVTGGMRGVGPGWFYHPTILLCKGDEDIVQLEQFGPVIPVVKFQSVEEAVSAANDSPNGLSGSVWGDVAEAMVVVEKLECGTQWVNQHSTGPGAQHWNLPFGGVKQSGIGKERGVMGILDYTDTVVVNARL